MAVSLRLAVAVTALLMASPAFAQDMDMDHSHMSLADQEYMTGMMRMKHDMKVTMTGDTDQDFVAMMLPHHQGAVAMAQTELKYGKDPEIRQMATDVVAAQNKEIAQMKAWQAAHPK